MVSFLQPSMVHVLFFLLGVIFQQDRMHCERTTQHYNFNIKMKNVTRLCHTKSIPTVNGKFPGPWLLARDGDRVIIKVTNHIGENVTLHWHGVRQLRNGWADGPAYITQCPIQTCQTYTYNFTIQGQRGTLFWHAHISWLRATLHGPIIILPKRNESYPFEKPHRDVPIILGEWWKSNPEGVIKEALRTGGNANASDAYTINGKPGPLYNCSHDTFKLKVDQGKTYLLRIINAALNVDLFFSVANHTLTVVEADGGYIKPFDTDIVHIAAGQTVNAILKAKPQCPNATFFMLVGPYATGGGSLDKSVAAGFLRYKHSLPRKNRHYKVAQNLLKPTIPPINATMFVFNFSSRFHSLRDLVLLANNFPREVDKRFFFTVGLGTFPCPNGKECQGPYGDKMAASINNVSFSLPSIALLEAYYYAQNENIYRPDFPKKPPFRFNYTGAPPEGTMVGTGTRVVELPFNTRVEVVLQDTSILGGENHPLHLHGFNFFVVGQGFGNFDQEKDPKSFNLVDPVERNTIGVPLGGWVAIRFLADNPGVWFMHCHFEIHTSWGLRMAWIVLDGSQPEQKMLPPPLDLPKC